MSSPASPQPASVNRREARRLAMCAQYAHEFTGYPVTETVPLLIGMKPDATPWPEFARQLCHTVEQHSDEIARDLESVLENWKLDRVAPIERAILKLGAAEICYFPDIPPRVTLNEYIEVAKYYANDNAPAFINGVLDRLSHLKGKKDFQSAKQAPKPRLYSASGAQSPSMNSFRQTSARAEQPGGTQLPARNQALQGLSNPGGEPASIPPTPPPATPTASASATPGGLDINRIQSNWAREIYEALSEIGGTAQIDELYGAIEKRSRLPLTAEWQMTVQGTLERYNGDSFSFEGNADAPHENLFTRIDRRKWGIRNR